MTGEDRVARLPRWAREKMINADRRVDQLEALLTTRDASPVAIVAGINDRLPIDQHYGIEYTLGEWSKIVARLHSRGYLEIAADHGALIVQPQASNLIRVQIGEWW